MFGYGNTPANFHPVEIGVYPAQNFANELLNIRSELELYKKLDSFFNTYEGGVKAHSLKVLIASAVLNKQVPSTSEERASLAEDASGFIKLQISSSISNNQANLAEQTGATDEASVENRFII